VLDGILMEQRGIPAAVICTEKGIARCVLLGKRKAIESVADALGIVLPPGLEILEPHEIAERYVTPMVALRKSKGLTPGQALLEWHRGKQGTIEQVHRVLKDELGAGVYPSGKFGANAAWLRLQVLTHNLLELFKAAGLDKAYRQARPKRLRFAIFNQVGRIVRHAGERFLRVAQRVLEELVWKWRRRFRRLMWAPT